MEQITQSIEEKCRQLGLAPAVIEQLKACLMSSTSGAQANSGAELEKLRAREKEIVQLLGAQGPDRILHDLRNLLNELQLLKAAMALEDEA